MVEAHLAETVVDKHLADRIVTNFHSYVASPRTVGRCLKYLLRLEGELVGTFWLGSGFKPTPKDILRHFDVSQKQFDGFFNEVADNKRFCLIKQIPNLGTRCLRAIRNRAREDWKHRYGDNLRAIVTTIGGGKTGAVYLADNWKKIGETSGLPSSRQSVSMKWNSAEEIGERFTKPTGENKKLIFISERL